MVAPHAAEDEHDADRDAARLLVAAAAQMWPIVLVLALLLGLGGGAFAVAWFGRQGRPASRGGRRSRASGTTWLAVRDPVRT